MSFHSPYPSLKLVYGSEWRGLPLLERQQPFGERYLEINLDIMKAAMTSQNRCFIVLLVLRLPYAYPIPPNGLITRFRKSLKSQVDADLHARSIRRDRSVKSDVHLVWTREKWQSDNCHFHVAVFLNGDAYNGVGSYVLPDVGERYQYFVPGRARAVSLHHRLTRAWASALGLTEEQGNGLVEYPNNSQFRVDSNAAGFQSDYFELFKRLSYMAKIRTKDFGGGADCYGSSRVATGYEYFLDYVY